MSSASRRTARWVTLGCAIGALACLSEAPAHAADFNVSANDRVVGQLQDYVVRQGDNLADIARKFDVGYTEMLAANPGVDAWVPRPGMTLTIPSVYILPDVPRQGIVMNLGERRLYYFPPDGGPMQTYPIGIGATGFDTPHSVSRVVRKEPNPTWIPTASIRAEEPGLPAVVGPGPDNPLGDYALRLGWKNYLIHGTNKPDGVGRNVSHGCIHLYPEDIEKLFNSTSVGTQVRVIDQPASAVWMGAGLYLEVHPSKEQADQIDTEQAVTPAPLAGLREQVAALTGDGGRSVDWKAADQAAYQRTGLPVEVAVSAPGPVAQGAPPAAPMRSAAPAEYAAAPAGYVAAPRPGDAVPPPAPPGSGVTPIFKTLRPPRDAAVPVQSIQSQPIPAGYGTGGAPQPLYDAAALRGTDDEGALRPEAPAPAAGPATLTPPDGYDAYGAGGDPDRPAWDRGYR
ncbi:MAG TPA: L,D-transpeptidase family protein [Stellaceae bacterium]|jgi:L,D-transpeptidase ErfK/SrfK|nr:L,D-transpeptidase family protein [Stellaceae bacterium]